MNLLMNHCALRRMALVLVVIVVPTFGYAQKKTSNSSPPPKASAPAKPAAPAQHSTTSNQSHTTNTTGRPGGAANTAHPATTTGNRPGTTGNRPGTTTTPGHGTTNTMNRGGTTTGTRPGATGTTGGRTGTNATTHGNTNTGHPGGTTTTHAAATHAAPGRQVSLKGGGTANIRPNGQIRSVNRNGMHIEHGMHGGRTVVSTRNGVRVVSVGHRGGYVQRAYVVRGGHSYYSRTYYYHGVYRAGVYRGYYWGGRPYYGYYPAYYYHPVYYGWAYNPWPAPVYYGWGWGAAPWYGYYGPYYAPYPVYPAAYFWLTDFMIAATLQAAYQAQAEANALLSPLDNNGTLVASLMPLAAADSKPAMSEEVKKALSEEVKSTLAAEKADAEKPKSNSSGGNQPSNSNEAPPALDPNFKTFIVASDMSLETDGDECALSQGDVIERTTDTADGDGNVTVKVVASNKSDCAIGKQGPVSTDDLQEMYNSFRESLKDGMGELAKKNGSGGLPKAPDTGTSDGDVPAPPPDKSAEKSLQDQQSAADQAETEVKQEAGSSGGGGAQ